MASSVDRAAIAQGLARSVALLPETMALGRALAADIDRVYLVAAGSANRAMLGMQYWIEHYSPSLEVRRSFPAELIAQDPKRLDARTLVLLASKSGTTPETVAAAEWLRNRPCRTVAFTQRAAAPLAKAVDEAFIIGETPESFSGLFMAMQSLLGGLMAAKDGWPLADKLLTSLSALPGAIADAAAANDPRGAADADALKDDRVLYHVASGPGFTTAYVFGVCIVMEMLWLHSTPLEAAEFFHGPFEVVDEHTKLILLLGEDPSRPLMERVVRFCRKYTEHLMVYDSRDFAMPGIDPEIRPIVAPYVLQAALKRVSAHLSVLLAKPLGERRYMWKTEYYNRMRNPPRILGLGDNTIDTYVDQGMQYPGGNAVNVAVLARRLGADTAYLGCLGSNAAGDLLLAALTAEHVETSRCRRRAGPNARAMIGHHDGDRCFIVSTRGVRGQYDLDDADFAYIAGFDLVHTSIFSELDGDLPRIRAVAKRISYDFSERWSDAAVAAALSHVDIAFLSCPNRSDADCAAVLRECIAHGARMAVATRGAAGAMALADGRLHTQDIVPADIVDTLGAGDGFIAAFLKCTLEGDDIATALAAGAQFAASVCRWHGAFGHGRQWADGPEATGAGG